MSRDLPPAIGSAAWDRELELLGVLRREVDDLVERGMAIGRDRQATCEGIDPSEVALTGHDVHFNPDVADDLDEQRCMLLRCAAWILFHETHPGYHAMMYLRFAYWDLREHDHLVDWVARQLAAMLVHGSPEIVESVEYSLGVDFFEDNRDAELILPRLLPIVEDEHRSDFLRQSGYITWAAKRDFYIQLIDDPDQHWELAQSLRDSFYSFFFGTVDVLDAYDLFQRLDRAHAPEWWDPEVRRDIIMAMTQPLRAWVESGIALHQSPDPHDAIVALAVAPLRTTPSVSYYGNYLSWLPGSEIYVDGQCHGVLRKARYSIDHERPFAGYQDPPRHTRVTASGPTPDEAAATIEWHGVATCEGSSVLELVGRWIELWPAGIWPLRAELPVL
jgi:hypothetical protein